MTFRCEAYRQRISRRRHLGYLTGGLHFTAPGTLSWDDEVVAWTPHDATQAEPLSIPIDGIEGMTSRGDPHQGRVVVDVLLDDGAGESIWFDAGAQHDLVRHLESIGWTWVKQPTRPGEPVLRPPGWVHPYRRRHPT